MNRYTSLATAEKLLLTNEQFSDAVRVEAIERGIEPPITLSEALRRSEWRGYQKPAEAIKVFRLICLGKYGSREASTFGYLDEALAQRAMEGMVGIVQEGYGDKAREVIKTDAPAVEVAWVTTGKADTKAASFEAFAQDDTAFNAVVDECVKDLSEVRQAEYNRKVRSEKRAEYLRLAGGDEQIARAFWAKTQSGEFPES